jgi:hypothetical protein
MISFFPFLILLVFLCVLGVFVVEVFYVSVTQALEF